MNYFIIGDIHGCYFTFLKMLQNWDKEKEHLISVGDLIDRGNFSALVLKECMQLSKQFPNTTFLKGNHEAEMIDYFEKGKNDNWLRQCGLQTLDDLQSNDLSLARVITWMKAMPLQWERENLLVTHAGVSNTEYPYDENNEQGVLWNRCPLKDLNKLQVHGHTPIKQPHPMYTESSHSWNIDTGAIYGYGLTALKVTDQDGVQDILHTPTQEQDTF